MEDKGLPSIKDMYNCTRQNFDYNVIRVYESRHKEISLNQKPTKKSHYLNDLIRLNCSPGPANNGNHQSVWYKKSPFQCRRAEKKTYLDQICIREKKNNSPSPNHYAISEQWPKKKDQVKAIAEKTNFADTCQFDSDQIPGPGSYNLRTYIGLVKKDEGKKVQPHQPIKPKEVTSAEVTTYSPCPLEYNTFARYSLMKNASQTNFEKKPTKAVGDKCSKENVSPGPAAYSTVSFWPGKSPPKSKQVNLFRFISKGPTFGVYH